MSNLSKTFRRSLSLLMILSLAAFGLMACGDAEEENQSEETANQEEETDNQEETATCDPGCTGDLVCTAGACGCPDELTRCGDTCVDSDNLCEISMEDIAFNPEQLTIHAGTTVLWTNLDGASHTVTSGTPSDASGELFDSGNLGTDETFEFTFDEAGDFPYYCIPHAGSMTAEITVLD